MLKRKSQGTSPAHANMLTPLRTDSDRKRKIDHGESAGPSMMAPVSRSVAIVVERSNDAKQNRAYRRGNGFLS